MPEVYYLLLRNVKVIPKTEEMKLRLKARRRRMVLECEPFIKPYEEYEAFGLY